MYLTDVSSLTSQYYLNGSRLAHFTYNVHKSDSKRTFHLSRFSSIARYPYEPDWKPRHSPDGTACLAAVDTNPSVASPLGRLVRFVISLRFRNPDQRSVVFGFSAVYGIIPLPFQSNIRTLVSAPGGYKSSNVYNS